VELTLALIGLSAFLAYLLVSEFMGDVSLHFMTRCGQLADEAMSQKTEERIKNACLKKASPEMQRLGKIAWGLIVLEGLCLLIIALAISLVRVFTDKLIFLIKG